MPKLDEKSLRRPDFVGGAPVVLADGEEWTLPRPVVVFVPDDTDIGFEVRTSLEDDAEFGQLMKACEDTPLVKDAARTTLAVARRLLLRNYDLTKEQVQDLLQFNFTDENSAAFARKEAVMAVAWGNTEEKPDAGGTPRAPTDQDSSP